MVGMEWNIWWIGIGVVTFSSRQCHFRLANQIVNNIAEKGALKMWLQHGLFQYISLESLMSLYFACLLFSCSLFLLYCYVCCMHAVCSVFCTLTTLTTIRGECGSAYKRVTLANIRVLSYGDFLCYYLQSWSVSLPITAIFRRGGGAGYRTAGCSRTPRHQVKLKVHMVER